MTHSKCQSITTKTTGHVPAFHLGQHAMKTKSMKLEAAAWVHGGKGVIMTVGNVKKDHWETIFTQEETNCWL